jgi:hypothetical protein
MIVSMGFVIVLSFLAGMHAAQNNTYTALACGAVALLNASIVLVK